MERMITSLLRKKGTSKYSLRKVTGSELIDSLYPSKGSTPTYKTYSLLAFPDRFNTYQITNLGVESTDILLHIDPSKLLDSAGDIVEITEMDQIIHEDGSIFNIIGKNRSGNWGIQKYYIKDKIILYSIQIRK